MPEAYPTTQAPTELGGASETSEVEEDTFIIRSLSSAYDSLVLNQRARQKQELEDNDSMVFLSMSQFDAYSINVGIDNHLENSSDKSPEFSIEGNQNWDMVRGTSVLGVVNNAWVSWHDYVFLLLLTKKVSPVSFSVD